MHDLKTRVVAFASAFCLLPVIPAGGSAAALAVAIAFAVAVAVAFAAAIAVASEIGPGFIPDTPTTTNSGFSPRDMISSWA